MHIMTLKKVHMKGMMKNLMEKNEMSLKLKDQTWKEGLNQD